MSTRDEIQPLLEEVARAILSNPATQGGSDYAKGAQEVAGMLILWDRLWPEDDPVGADWLAERDRRMKAEAWTEGWNAAVTAPPYAMHPQPLACAASSLPAGDLCVCPKCEGVPNPYA